MKPFRIKRRLRSEEVLFQLLQSLSISSSSLPGPLLAKYTIDTFILVRIMLIGAYAQSFDRTQKIRSHRNILLYLHQGKNYGHKSIGPDGRNGPEQREIRMA